jgi:hypothetical protein
LEEACGDISKCLVIDDLQKNYVCVCPEGYGTEEGI